MSRILKRPMFMKGGSVGQGIMNKVERKMYNKGTTFEEAYKKIQPLYKQAVTQKRDDDLANFLIRGGLNLISGSGKEDQSLLQELSSAYRGPTEEAIKAKSGREALQMQGDIAALGAAAKIAGATTRPLKDQTIEGQVENYYSNISKTASASKLQEAYELRPQITKAFKLGISPRIAPKNLKGNAIDPNFYEGKQDGFTYINPITGRFEMIFNGKPFRRIDQDTLKPITTGE